MSFTLQSLPVEMIYRIFDHLDDEELFLSTNNVCQRLNTILYSYQRYQVNHTYSVFRKKKNILFTNGSLFSHIFHVLNLLQTLTELNLQRNRIKEQGVQYLSEALKINRVRS